MLGGVALDGGRQDLAGLFLGSRLQLRSKRVSRRLISSSNSDSIRCNKSFSACAIETGYLLQERFLLRKNLVEQLLAFFALVDGIGRFALASLQEPFLALGFVVLLLELVFAFVQLAFEIVHLGARFFDLAQELFAFLEALFARIQQSLLFDVFGVPASLCENLLDSALPRHRPANADSTPKRRTAGLPTRERKRSPEVLHSERP